MCGINGVIYKSQIDSLAVKEKLTGMNDLIVHRGPDDHGVFVHQNDHYSVGMAMRRLSIIDLTTGHQPMYSEDKSIVVVFNGEIYNFKELKRDLEKDNIVFQTHSDTEVIIKLYEKYGADGFKLLDGMYGMSIFDAKKNKIFIARDYFGEKPLYYTQTDTAFFWASELKSIINSIDFKPEIDKNGFNLYFRLTYIPAPYTIYEGIHKLEANSCIEYDLNTHAFKIHNIHNTILPNRKSDISFDEAKKEVKERVYNSVKSRSIADVPLGTFLSGGVDSSVVSYCLADMSDKKIDTFSIGFEKARFDESDKSRTVAKLINSNHHEFIINESDLKNNIDAILLNFDEPFADSSALPTYLVSKKTSSDLTVALTGDGGDEIFGGYNKYYIGKLNARYTSVVPKFLHNGIHGLSSSLLKRKDDNRGFKYKLNKLINAIDYGDSYYWDIISLGFSDLDIDNMILDGFKRPHIFEYYKTKSNIANPKSLNDFRTIDRYMSLEGDMLVKVDRTSMMNSLECRAPFLNRELFEYTLGLSEDFLLKKWSKKHILKEAFKDDFPEGFLEKSKQGFGVPVGDWLREGLQDELRSYSDRKFLSSQNIFNPETIIELVEDHLNQRKDNTFNVWTFYCFQKWYTRTYQKQ